MANQFLLEILTPERIFFKERVDMAMLPASDGMQGIMAGHEKMVIALVSGIIRIQSGADWREAVCAEGYAIIYGDHTVVLAQSMEWPEEIDEKRVYKAIERAESRLEDSEVSDRDKHLNKMALARAHARCALLQRHREKER